MNATITQTILKLSILITGLLMLGEAKVLFTGLRLSISSKNPWFIGKNRLWLFLDVIFGFILLAFMFRTGSDSTSVLFLIFVCFALITHGYREWEYLARREYRYCANTPQFIVNNLKLTGLLLILFAGLS